MENNSFCKDSKYCNLDWIHNNIDSIIVKCSSAWFWTSVMDTCISFYFILILTLFYTCKLLMFVLVFSTWFRMASLLDSAIRCLDSNLLWFSSNTNLFNHSILNKKNNTSLSMSHKKHSEYPSRVYLFFVSTTIHSYPLFISIHQISCKNKCDLFVEKTLYKWRTHRCSTRRCTSECLETCMGMDSCLFIQPFHTNMKCD